MHTQTVHISLDFQARTIGLITNTRLLCVVFLFPLVMGTHLYLTNYENLKCLISTSMILYFITCHISISLQPDSVTFDVSKIILSNRIHSLKYKKNYDIGLQLYSIKVPFLTKIKIIFIYVSSIF